MSVVIQTAPTCFTSFCSKEVEYFLHAYLRKITVCDSKRMKHVYVSKENHSVEKIVLLYQLSYGTPGGSSLQASSQKYDELEIQTAVEGVEAIGHVLRKIIYADPALVNHSNCALPVSSVKCVFSTKLLKTFFYIQQSN